MPRETSGTDRASIYGQNKVCQRIGSNPIEDESLLSPEGLKLHLIFAHHVSHAGEATLVHRVVPPQKKRENENDEGMDEQNENKRRTLLYDRDGPSDVPSGLPSESNSRASFEMTDDFRDTSSELLSVNANDAISGEKSGGVLKLNWISEDLYGDLEWIPESKRKPYRETGEQMYDNSRRNRSHRGGEVSQDGL